MSVKSKVPAGDRILYLHVTQRTKKFFNGITRKLDSKEQGRITKSMVAERILRNLKKNPRLLKEAIK